MAILSKNHKSAVLSNNIFEHCIGLLKHSSLINNKSGICQWSCPAYFSEIYKTSKWDWFIEARIKSGTVFGLCGGTCTSSSNMAIKMLAEHPHSMWRSRQLMKPAAGTQRLRLFEQENYKRMGDAQGIVSVYMKHYLSLIVHI